MHTDAVDSVLGTKKAEAIGQFDLFGGDDGCTESVFTIKVPDDEWEDKHKLALEREMLGLYVSGHPLNGVAHLLAAQVDTQIPAILDGDVANETQVRVGGILASVNRRVNKNGMPWASAQLEDLTGGIEVMFFPHAYSSYGADIADDTVVLINAKVAIRDDRISLIANELVVPDFSTAQVNRPIAVSLPTRQCTIDKVSALKQVLARHPGTSQVHLRLISGDRITTLELDASLRVTPSPALMGTSRSCSARAAWAASGARRPTAGGAAGRTLCPAARLAAHCGARSPQRQRRLVVVGRDDRDRVARQVQALQRLEGLLAILVHQIAWVA